MQMTKPLLLGLVLFIAMNLISYGTGYYNGQTYVLREQNMEAVDALNRYAESTVAPSLNSDGIVGSLRISYTDEWETEDGKVVGMCPAINIPPRGGCLPHEDHEAN